MGGPVYRYDAANPSTTKFPPSLDGHFFAGEFGRGWIKPIDVNADGSAGQITDFPWRGKQVMDMAFGPDGALYVLDYGTGYFNGDANSALYRFDYIGRRQPGADRAAAAADQTSGQPPADRRLLLGRLVRPRGRRADLLVELRRRHHLDRGQPDQDLHRQRHVHGRRSP